MLEDRRLLAYNEFFAVDVAQNLSTLQQQVNSLIDANTTGLPVLGTAAALNALDSTQFIQDAADKLLNPGLGPYGNSMELDQQLEQLFNTNDVTIWQGRGFIDVEIPLHGVEVESSTTLALDTGLVGLPVQFSTGPDAGIDFTMEHDYRLAFQYVDEDRSFTLDDPNGSEPEFGITLGASLAPGFEAACNHRVSWRRRSPTIRDSPPELSMTLTANGLNDINTATVDINDVEAHLDLHVDTGIAAYTENFPSVATDFVSGLELSHSQHADG